MVLRRSLQLCTALSKGRNVSAPRCLRTNSIRFSNRDLVRIAYHCRVSRPGPESAAPLAIAPPSESQSGAVEILLLTIFCRAFPVWEKCGLSVLFPIPLPLLLSKSLMSFELRHGASFRPRLPELVHPPVGRAQSFASEMLRVRESECSRSCDATRLTACVKTPR